MVADPPDVFPGGSPKLLDELWKAAEAGSVGLGRAEFGQLLQAVGSRTGFGRPQGSEADEAERAAYWRSLKLPEFALAQACALGQEPAWQRFVAAYRTPLTQAAIAMTGSQTLGRELADSLYAELYGLRAAADGTRRSPLAGYSGRGSLLGWLRTTLAQRHVDHHRRTRREQPLDPVVEPVAPESEALPATAPLEQAVARTLGALPAESRFLLAAYFLDGQTLAALGRTLRVHEATVSRQLKRLAGDLRKQLLRELERGGMSRRAAEEALGTDPRDVDMNLRRLLQGSQTASFSAKSGAETEAKRP